MTALQFKLAASNGTTDIAPAMLGDILEGEGRIVKIEPCEGGTAVTLNLCFDASITVLVLYDGFVAGAVAAPVPEAVEEDMSTGAVIEGYDASNNLRRMDDTQQADEDTESQSEGIYTEPVSSVASMNDATAGNDKLTMHDFLSSISEGEGALMRDQGHSAVYNRPRMLQRVSWDTTEEDLVGLHDRVAAEEIPYHDAITDEEL